MTDRAKTYIALEHMVKCLFADRLGRKIMREIERPLPPYYTLASLDLPLGLEPDWYAEEVDAERGENQTRLYRLADDLRTHARYEEL